MYKIIGEAKIGGTWRKFFAEKDNKIYLLKAGEKYGELRPLGPVVDEIASKVASLIFNESEFLKVGRTVLDYGFGPIPCSVQPYIKQKTIDYRQLIDISLSVFSDEDIIRIQREQVLDWLISNHDSHGNQWIRLEGNLIGIDKTQSCKYILTDELNPDYHPNAVYGEDYPLYHYLYYSSRDMKREHIEDVICKIENIPNSEYILIFGELLQHRPEIKDRLLERKINLRRDFDNLYS